MRDNAGAQASRAALAAALVAWFAFFLVFGRHGFNLREDGYLLTLAARVLRGDVPYRDFAYVRPPLPIAVPAILLEAVPAHAVAAARWYVAAQTAVILVVADALLRRLEPSPWRRAGYVLAGVVLGCTGGFPPAPWHTVDGMFFSALAIAALVTAVERHAPGLALAGGLAASAAALSKQGFALVAMGGLGFALSRWGRGIGRRPWVGAAAYVVGLAVPVGALLGYLAAHGALGAALRSVVLDPREITRDVLRLRTWDLLVGMHLPEPTGAVVGLLFLALIAVPMPGVLAAALGAGLAGWMALTFWVSRFRVLWAFVLEPVYTLVWVGALGLLARQAVGRGRLAPTSAWALGLAQCALYASAWSYVGLRSAAFGFALVLPLVVSGLHAGDAVGAERRRAASWLVAALALVSALGQLPTRVHYTEPFVSGGLASVQANPDRVRAVDEVVALIRRETAPAEPIVVLENFPALYFVADRPNATRVDWFIPQELTQAEARHALADLEAHPPRLVILTDGADPARGTHRLLRPILAFLAQHYDRVRQIGDFGVYRARDGVSSP